MRSLVTKFTLVSSLMALVVILASPGCGGDDEDYCAIYCPAVLAAGCDNGPADLNDCLGGCRTVQQMCGSQFDALADCAGGNPTFDCNAYDSPAPVGCDSQNDVLTACLQQVSVFCVQSCPEVVAAGCTNGPGDLDDCLSGCGASETSCPTEFQAVAQCAGSSPTFACDANLSPYPEGCQTQNDALLLCL